MPSDLQTLVLMGLPLFILAVASGWYAGRRDTHYVGKQNDRLNLSQAYFRGLNFLLNEQPDKAIEVFIEVLEVNSDTVETHLALGNLFRRRGEVERAIRIHQNLIARPTLDADQRAMALLELGQDYLKAGLFDRAENLFTELVENRMHSEQALQLLLHIYQQEKEWEQAIATARRLGRLAKDDLSGDIAHFHCELAQLAIADHNIKEARRQIRKALSTDASCVRASMLLGDIEFSEGRYKEAIRIWKRIEKQDPRFLGEVIDVLAQAHGQVDDESGMYGYLSEAAKRHRSVDLMAALAQLIKDQQGIDAAEHFVANWLRETPSINGLQHLIELNLLQAEGTAEEDLKLLNGIIGKLEEQSQRYHCGHCGFKGQSMHWRCPSCNHWNSIVPTAGEICT